MDLRRRFGWQISHFTDGKVSECGYHHSSTTISAFEGATITPKRKYLAFEGATITHTRLASRGRECPRRGLGGFVGFRQLPSRPGEYNVTEEIDRPYGNERPTRVTAGNRRSRRPGFWPAHEAHAPLARIREWNAEGVPHARASQGEASRVRADYINIRCLGTSALKGAEVPRFLCDVVLNLSISALKGAEMPRFWRGIERKM